MAVAWAVRSRAFLDLSRDRADSTLVLGSARSGTTWIGEVLDRNHDHRVIFEPFRPGTVPALQPFEGVRYLDPGDPSAPHRSALAALLEGRIRNAWADHTTRVLVARRRLVKEIRANCLGPWIATQFPESAMVVVIRHPLDVVASRMTLGWKDHLDELLEQHLPPDLSLPVVEQMNRLDDGVSRAMACWVLETIVPLRLLPAGAGTIVLYERLQDSPLEGFSEILRHVGQVPDAALQRAVDRPSRTSRPGVTADARAPGHELALTVDQREACRRLLASVGLDALYDLQDKRPDANALLRLRGAPGPSF